MGVITCEYELSSTIPPAKMFKAFVLDADSLIPKIVPQAIRSVETVEGDGGAGTIKIITFGEGSPFKTMKHRVDAIDTEEFTYNYSIVEGDALGSIIEKICYEVKIVAAPDGGSICKNISTYHTVGELEFTEEQVKAGKEKASAIFKAVEAYLLANPDAYP